MYIVRHKKFIKAFKKQNSKIQLKFIEVLGLFMTNPNNPQLNTHALKGTLLQLHSFDITADIRVHFYIQQGAYVFVNIGTHSELY